MRPNMNDAQLRELEVVMSAPTGKVIERRISCLCGGNVTAAAIVKRHSGVVNFVEALCPSCKKEFTNFARVVCLGCRKLQLLVAPQKMKTGFEFKPNTAVHIARCHSCNPHATHAPVMEHAAYCRNNYIPTNADEDIAQEVRRNYLQGVAGADKLRVELQGTFSTS